MLFFNLCPDLIKTQCRAVLPWYPFPLSQTGLSLLMKVTKYEKSIPFVWRQLLQYFMACTCSTKYTVYPFLYNYFFISWPNKFTPAIIHAVEKSRCKPRILWSQQFLMRSVFCTVDCCMIQASSIKVHYLVLFYFYRDFKKPARLLWLQKGRLGPQLCTGKWKVSKICGSRAETELLLFSPTHSYSIF